MYVENYFKGGNYVTLIPIGLPVTLQYNISGNLEKVFIGYDSDRRDVSNTIMMSLLSREYVPAKISITKGTSWVYGVLYTGDIPTDTYGPIPDCIEVALETKYANHPEQFRFYACNIECTSIPFNSSTQVNNYLHLARFNVLPGWIVPAVMDHSVFDKWINSTQYTFKPIVMGYTVFSKDGINIVKTNISQHVVSDTVFYNDDNGYYKLKATLDDESDIYLPYSTVKHYGLTKNTIVYLDSKHNVFNVSGATTAYEDIIRCPYCHKHYNANLTVGEESICSDIHCTSRLIRPIQRFLNILRLPDMNVSDIRDYINDGTFTCITDIFEIEPYKSSEIDATIGMCLQAMIPITLIQKSDVYAMLSTACSNDIKTVMYYINHPGDIISDLKINHPDVQKLMLWLSDDCNARDLTTVLELDQIKIKTIDKFFEGAPIFRNKLIYITGDFIHGNLPEISSILQSYSARVTTVFSNLVDCVLIGGTNENVSGKDVVSARNMGIPIMQEVDFFEQYDIDSDLANLV